MSKLDNRTIDILNRTAKVRQQQKPRTLKEILDEPKYKVSVGGTDIGYVGYRAHKAIESNTLDSYTPANEEEKTTIEAYRDYLNKKLGIQTSEERRSTYNYKEGVRPPFDPITDKAKAQAEVKEEEQLHNATKQKEAQGKSINTAKEFAEKHGLKFNENSFVSDTTLSTDMHIDEAYDAVVDKFESEGLDLTELLNYTEGVPQGIKLAIYRRLKAKADEKDIYMRNTYVSYDDKSILGALVAGGTTPEQYVLERSSKDYKKDRAELDNMLYAINQYEKYGNAIDLSYDELKSKYNELKTKKDSKQNEEALFYLSLANQKHYQTVAKKMSEVKIDGENISVLEALEKISKSDNAKEKNKLWEKCKAKFEEYGYNIDEYYSVLTGGKKKNADTMVKWAGTTAMQGIGSFTSGIASTLDLILGTPLDAIGWENNPFHVLSEGVKTEYQDFSFDRQYYSDQMGGGKALEIGGDILSATFGALPDLALAYATAGISKAGTMAVSTATATGILGKAGITVTNMAKNPNFWLSFARTLGPNYEKAKEHGADDITALYGSLIESYINAGIEIGIDGASGIQGLAQEVVEGNSKRLYNWIKSSLDEGKEEVLQGLVSRGADKYIYGANVDVINPQEMLKEGSIGVSVGSILGSHTLIPTNQNFEEIGAFLRYDKKGKERADVISAIIEEGLSLSPESQSFKLATEAKKQLDNGKKISDNFLGRLYLANVDALKAENSTSIIDAEYEGDDTNVPKTPQATPTNTEETTPTTKAVETTKSKITTPVTVDNVSQTPNEVPTMANRSNVETPITEAQAKGATSVNVGDTFTDTQNGDTIKVISRDEDSSTVEFTDKDGNVATTTLRNSVVDAINTNPRYAKESVSTTQTETDVPTINIGDTFKVNNSSGSVVKIIDRDDKFTTVEVTYKSGNTETKRFTNEYADNMKTNPLFSEIHNLSVENDAQNTMKVLNNQSKDDIIKTYETFESHKPIEAIDIQADKKRRAEATEQYGLTPDETTRLTDYVGGQMCYILNKRMLNGTLVDGDLSVINSIRNALLKLPEYSGRTYRNLQLKTEKEYNDFLSEHSEGNIVELKAFTSTSKLPNGYTKFGNGVVHLVIDGVSGRDIADTFGLPRQQEVIYLPKTKIEIKKVMIANDGNPLIFAQEVKANENIRTKETGNTGDDRPETSVYQDINGQGTEPVRNGGDNSGISREVSNRDGRDGVISQRGKSSDSGNVRVDNGQSEGRKETSATDDRGNEAEVGAGELSLVTQLKLEATEKKKQAVMARFGLTEEEANAVLEYKTAEAYKINAKLRENEELLTDTQKEIVKLLDIALEKLPKHKGKVYRTVSFDDLFDAEEEYNLFLESHSQDSVVLYDAFTSTSSKPDGHPMSDDTKYGITLEIEGGSGRDIDGFGNNFEKEIVFPRGFSFVVTDVTTDNKGRPYIKIKEVSENDRQERHTEERSDILQRMRNESEGHGDLSQISKQDTKRSIETKDSVQRIQTNTGKSIIDAPTPPQNAQNTPKPSDNISGNETPAQTEAQTENVATTQNLSVTEPKEIQYSTSKESEEYTDGGERNLLSNGSRKRSYSTSTRKQTKGVDGRSRRYKEGRTASYERRKYCQTLKTSGNIREEIVYGHKCEVIPTEHYTPLMTEIADSNKRDGIDETVFITGKARIPFTTDSNGNSKTARGVFIKANGRKIIIVQYDNEYYTPKQINDHEKIHDRYHTSLVQKARNVIINNLSVAEKQRVYENLSRDYNGIIEGNEEAIEEEFVANVLSEMDYEFGDAFSDIRKAYWKGDADAIDNFKVSEYTHSTDAGGVNSNVLGNIGFGDDTNFFDNTTRMEVFPPYNVSHSEANEIATRWAHREDVKKYARKIVHFNGNAYVVEKDSTRDLMYRIVVMLDSQEIGFLETHKTKRGRHNERNKNNNDKQSGSGGVVSNSGYAGAKHNSRRGNVRDGFGADRHTIEADRIEKLDKNSNEGREDFSDGRGFVKFGIEDSEDHVKYSTSTVKTPENIELDEYWADETAWDEALEKYGAIQKGEKPKEIRYSTSKESEEFESEQTRNDLLSGNSDRGNNESTRKQTQRISDFKQSIKGKTEAERKGIAKELLAEGQTEEVIENITDSYGKTQLKYNLVKPEAYNDDMRSIVEEAKAEGKDVGFFIGSAKRAMTDLKIDAMISGKRVLLRYDGYFSPQSLFKHEDVHNVYDTPEMQKAKDIILNDLSEADKEKILSQERYRNYLFLNKGNKEKVWEEFVADIFAGMSDYTDNYIDMVSTYWYNGEILDSFNISEYTHSIDAGGVHNDTLYSVSDPKWHTGFPKRIVMELERRVKQDVQISAKSITDTSNWYATKINGIGYFVIYSTEVVDNPTILYASKGEQAKYEQNVLKFILEDYYNGRSNDGTSTIADQIFGVDWVRVANSVRNTVQRVGRVGDSRDASVLQRKSKRQPSGAFKNVIRNLLEVRDTNGNSLTSKNQPDEIKYSASTVKTPENIELDEYLADETAWDEALEKYGAIQKGEKPARDIDVPKKRANNEPISWFARTALEAGITPNEVVDDFQREVMFGKMAHEVITDKESEEKAIAKIKRLGFEGAVNNWNELFRDNKINKNDFVFGMVLYNQAVTSKDYKLAMKLISDLTIISSESAQVLQSVRMLKKMSPDGTLYYLEKSVEKMNEDFKEQLGRNFKDIEIDSELMRELYEAETAEERDEAIEKIEQNIADQIPSTLLDKWNAWRYLAMLGNVRTHGRNIWGNMSFWCVRRVKNLVGAVIEKTIPAEQRTKTIKKSKDAVEFAKKDAEVMKDILTGTSGKYEMANKIQQKRKIFKPNWIEFLRQKNYDFLEAEDWWFLKGAYQDSLAQLITARGLDIEFLQSGTSEANELLNRVRAYAINEAKVATFRQASELGNAINRVKRSFATSNNKGKKAVGALLEGVMPFTSVPINIAKQGVAYSPIGLVKGIYEALHDVKTGDKTASEAIDSLSKGLTGTAIVALGALLSTLGLIVAEPDEDDKKKAYDRMRGHQSYALQIDDHSFTIDWLAPLALPLFVGVELENLANDDGLSGTDIINALSRIVDPMVELSVLQGVSDALNNAKYTEEEPFVTVPTGIITSYLGQALPTLGGQIARLVDNEQKKVYIEKGEGFLTGQIKEFIQTSAKKIPFATYLLEPQIDAWGKVKTYGSFGERIVESTISPGYYSKITTTEVDEELHKLFEATGDNSVYPPSNTVKSITVEKHTYYLTAEQSREYAEIRGQESLRRITNLINNEKYKNMSDKEKLKWVKHAYEKAKEKAKETIFEKHFKE